uniref:PX domain-containing protein n=1 Tax=Rodentolepis nana TaxID=102285 RepID=A0A0R3TDX1_RODNA
LLEALRPAGMHESELLASPEDYIDYYQHQVHWVDSPAVPFIAVGGQTRLIHLELKLNDYLPGGSEKEPLINFSKCHQIADLKEHYLSFQNIPFNLQPDPVIQDFLKQLDPHALAGVKDEAEFEDLMFQQSLCIQPREGTTPNLSNFPSAESSMNRQLTATELRVGNLISAAPIDVNMKTGFKEFRQLIAITSISPDAKFDFATSANSVLLPNRTPSCGSLGRGLKVRDQLSASCSASSTECSSRVSPALHIEPGAPPPLPPKPTVVSLHASPLPVGEWRDVFASNSEHIDVTDFTTTVAAPPLPPRASASPSIDRIMELSPRPLEECHQCSRSANPTASLERRCQLGGPVDGRPPPPPPKTSTSHFSTSLHSNPTDGNSPI